MAKQMVIDLGNGELLKKVEQGARRFPVFTITRGNAVVVHNEKPLNQVPFNDVFEYMAAELKALRS